jgi:hypothetical protein
VGLALWFVAGETRSSNTNHEAGTHLPIRLVQKTQLNHKATKDTERKHPKLCFIPKAISREHWNQTTAFLCTFVVNPIHRIRDKTQAATRMKGLRSLLLICGLVALAGCSRSPDPVIGAQLIKTAPALDARWEAAVAVTRSPPPPFLAQIEFVARPEFAGKTVDEVLALLPKDYPYTFVFIADERALTEPGFPCYCVDLKDEQRPRFRLEARQIASVENNLTLANMIFAEFAVTAKETGVFRGFQGPL